MAKDGISKAYGSIRQILEAARKNAFRAVNFAMVEAYWEIGRVIVEEEQKGKGRAEYGGHLIAGISARLKSEFGNGFDERNLWYMRSFYLNFKKMNALRSELTWTHYRLLLRADNENARKFYLNEAINSRWSTRELERQMDSLLYERLALSGNRKKVLELSERGQIIRQPQDIVKDPFVLEFLGMKENSSDNESALEERLISHLKDFLLELGRGFSFVGRQKRLTVGNDHFYVDLVFYNHILKCFVLIDLKIGKLDHRDIGQMDFYVRYFEKEVRREGDNPTVGIILCSDKNDALVKYTLLEGNNRLFASKYRLVLPDKNELRDALRQAEITG